MPSAEPAATVNAPPDLPHLLALAGQGGLDLADLMRASDALVAQGQRPQAVQLARAWLPRGRDAQRPLVYFLLGLLLTDEGDHDGARSQYLQALQLAPAFAAARFNLGLACQRLGDHDEAVAQWQWIDSHALPSDPQARALQVMSLGNLARAHESAGRRHEALACLTRSLQLEPRQPDLVRARALLRAQQCLWPVFDALPGLDEATQRLQSSGLPLIAHSEDPAEQLAAAQAYAQRHVPAALPRLAPERTYGHPRLRIGYASGDFWQHPVAMLTAEVFGLHDRSRFEVHAFDWSRDDGSALRQRVLAGFDHVEPLHGLDDAAGAARIRSLEIDILVDLQGVTQGARLGLLARRPAPVQVTWLGLPATTGLPFIDHVLADPYLIPDAERAHYSERPLRLPELFQPSDRQRLAGPVPTRADCGLPDEGFVFCCFNNSYKITPDLFSIWMSLLQRVPGSVLWLLADHADVQANLRREATARGVHPERLVFAPRTQTDVYLARYALADLFLDCYPFNGGTTVNDALWMGLPVLTRSGRTYASRMAGSLLHTAGLTELICSDSEAYLQQAVSLATTPHRLPALRTALQQARHDSPLFDTPRLVRHLERLFEQLAAEAGSAAGAVNPPGG